MWPLAEDRESLSLRLLMAYIIEVMGEPPQFDSGLG